MNLTPTHKQQYFVYVISAIAALAGLLFGFDTGVISGAILFIREEFQLTSTSIELVVSAVLLGALLGAVFSGRVVDKFGRRRVILATALIFAVGSLLTAWASEVSSLIAGRLMLGVAIGIASYAAPLYLAEVAPPRIRGFLVSLNQLAVTCGIVMSYLVDYGFSNSGNWRFMLGFGVIPALILLIGMWFLPESPRWLVLQERDEEAGDILSKIRSEDEIAKEVKEIKASLAEEQGTWRLLLAKSVRPVLVIALGLAVFQQITGINTIIYYAPTIFTLAGFHSAQAAILATLGVGVANVLFTILALPLIDKWGRRPLLLIGLAAMTLSLFVLAYAFHTNLHSTALRWVTLSSLLVFIAGFAIGLGPMLWLIISEIFPLGVRGLGMSFATAANWGSNLIVALTFLTLVNNLGASDTFMLYAVLSLLTSAFVYFYVPETKGCSLETIEHNLLTGKPSRELGVPVKKTNWVQVYAARE